MQLSTGSLLFLLAHQAQVLAFASVNETPGTIDQDSLKLPKSMPNQEEASSSRHNPERILHIVPRGFPWSIIPKVDVPPTIPDRPMGNLADIGSSTGQLIAGPSNPDIQSVSLPRPPAAASDAPRLPYEDSASVTAALPEATQLPYGDPAMITSIARVTGVWNGSATSTRLVGSVQTAKGGSTMTTASTSAACGLETFSSMAVILLVAAVTAIQM